MHGGKERFEEVHIPAGGWGSAKAIGSRLLHEHALIKGSRVILHQNKPHGFACVSCSWAKPAQPHAVEACENGIKATAWEITSKRTPPEFFARHTVAELLGWSDLALEAEGRLTAPLRWDSAADKYVPVTWEQAFADIGGTLKRLPPKSVVFYASGRASLETAFMYSLLARIFGCNNLPDSSNMCHESTSVALPQTIGVPVGTVVLEDFAETDFFGQNVSTNTILVTAGMAAAPFGRFLLMSLAISALVLGAWFGVGIGLERLYGALGAVSSYLVPAIGVLGLLALFFVGRRARKRLEQRQQAGK